VVRNLSILIALVVGQLGITFVHQITPPLVDWSWQIRLTVGIFIFIACGAAAFTLFVGPLWQRIVWVALSAALPSVIGELFLWSDAAYLGLGYLMAIGIGVFASLGALCVLPLVANARSGRNKPFDTIASRDEPPAR
jgi:hypothetical protein